MARCEEANKDFEGMQPTLRQVPPKVEYFSIIAVFNPSWEQRIADTYPPGPEPIIITSNELIILFFLCVAKLQIKYNI